MDDKIVHFDAKRQDGPESTPYWEDLNLRRRPAVNVLIGLMDIAMHPVDRRGKQTTPIPDDSNHLEEVCGSCAMRINGHAAMSWTWLIDGLEQPIRLEPLAGFPVIRDLTVDDVRVQQALEKWRGYGGTIFLHLLPKNLDEAGEIDRMAASP